MRWSFCGRFCSIGSRNREPQFYWLLTPPISEISSSSSYLVYALLQPNISVSGDIPETRCSSSMMNYLVSFATMVEWTMNQCEYVPAHISTADANAFAFGTACSVVQKFNSSPYAFLPYGPKQPPAKSFHLHTYILFILYFESYLLSSIVTQSFPMQVCAYEFGIQISNPRVWYLFVIALAQAVNTSCVYVHESLSACLLNVAVQFKKCGQWQQKLRVAGCSKNLFETSEKCRSGYFSVSE